MDDLSEAEAVEFWRYIQGGRYSGAARRMRAEFIAAHGWSDAEVKHVTAALSVRFGGPDAPRETDGATSGDAPERPAPTA